MTAWRRVIELSISDEEMATKLFARTMEDQEMKGNDILDVCRRLNKITDELAAMVDEEN